MDEKQELPALLPDSAALLDDYLQHLLVEDGLAENTLKAYAADISDFLAFTSGGNMPVSDITDQTIFLYIIHVRRHGLGGRSLARRLSALRGFFAYAREEDILHTDPTQFMENPKFQKKLPDVLSQEEMHGILARPNLNDKLGFRDRTMLELLYASGLRVSELCGLKPVDFDNQSGFLRIFGKGSKERLVPLHGEAVQWLDDYLRHWRPLFNPVTDFVFLNRSGKRLSRIGVWKLVQRYAREAGIRRDISPHSFRHSFATHLLDGGADLRSVQMLLGHSDINATEIYIHVQDGRLLDVHQAHHPRSQARSGKK